MVSYDNSPVCKANGNWDLTEDYQLNSIFALIGFVVADTVIIKILQLLLNLLHKFVGMSSS